MTLKVYIFFLILFLFSLFSLYSTISHQQFASSISLEAGKFEVFNITVIYYSPHYCIQKIIEIEEVEKVFCNDTMLINQTEVLPNITAYLPAGTFLQKITCSEGFFYIAPCKLGHNTSSFIYNGTKDGLYVYYNISYALCSKYIFILYYNASGIPIKGCDIKCCCGKIGMKAIYVLWKTNLINNESLPNFPGYTLASTLTYNFSKAAQGEQRFHDILLGITSLGLSIIILILLFRPKMRMNDNEKKTL